MAAALLNLVGGLIMRVKVYDQDGIYQTDVTYDDYRVEAHKRGFVRDENYTFRNWSAFTTMQAPSVFTVMVVRENHLYYQCAVYTTKEEAEAAAAALRALVKEWENIKESKDGQAPTYQFPKAKEPVNALSIVKRWLNHSGH